MRKRMITLTLVAGVLLSLCASAWAAGGYTITDVSVGYTTLYNVTKRTSETISIYVRATVRNYGSGETSNSYSTNATKVKLALDLDDELQSGYDFAPATGSSGTKVTGEVAVTFDLASATGEQTYTAYLSGKFGGEAGDVTATGTLLQSNGNVATGTSGTMSDTATIEFSTDSGEDEGPQTEETPSRTNTSDLQNTTADPTYSGWDGKAPPYSDSSKTSANTKDKPKINTTKLSFTAGTAATAEIEVTGPLPSIDVYIAEKDAKKLYGDMKDSSGNALYSSGSIRLTQANIATYSIPFRITAATFAGNDQKSDSNKLTLAYNGAYVSYKDFPLTISATNNATKNSKTGVQKPVTKVVKITVSGVDTPRWLRSGKVPSVNGKANNAEIVSKLIGSSPSGAIDDTVFTVSGDGPYVITAKPLEKDKAKVTISQPVFDRFGNVSTPGTVTISGKTKDTTKESKAAFTITVTNPSTKKKTALKATVIGKMPPVIQKTAVVEGSTIKALTGTKTAEAGKVPSVKFTAKGSKTITWSLVDNEETSTSAEDVAEALLAHGLSFDAKKGAIVKASQNSKPTITSDDAGNYEPITITVQATNDASFDIATATVGVTGKKPKFTTKTVKVERTAEAGSLVGVIETNLTDDDDANITYTVDGANDDKPYGSLGDLGLVLVDGDEDSYDEDYTNKGVILIGEEALTTATDKDVQIAFIASNWGNEVIGKVKISIVDPSPDVQTSDGDDTGSVSISGVTTKAAATGKIEFKVTDETKPTNENGGITYKIQKKPKNNKLSAKLTDNKNGTAKVVVTQKKGEYDDDIEDEMTIRATNKTNKRYDDIVVTITADAGTEEAGASPRNVGTSPKPESDSQTQTETPELTEDSPEPETESESAEPEVTLGAARTAENLTAAQRSVLEAKGYEVVAVLPEVTANADGQYDFEVELSDDAPEGAKLIWLAFPKDAEASEDDKIVDFYDEAGAAIQEVPAGKTIIVSPWLRGGVTYAPVIAVETK